MTIPPSADMQPNSGKALASMIVGIVSFLLCLYAPISVPGGIVAIVLGVLGRNETKAGTHKGAGMALTGIILGAIVVVVIGGLWLLSIFLPDTFQSDWLTEQICEQQPDNPICDS